MAPRKDDAHLAAWRQLLAVQAQLIREVEDALSAAGLPGIAWYDVLLPLHQKGRPLRMGELSDEVVTIGRTGLTRLVDRLEKEGVLSRQHCTADRRGVEVAITPAGSDLLRRMWPVYSGVVQERMVKALNPSQVAQLSTLLGRVAESSDSAP